MCHVDCIKRATERKIDQTETEQARQKDNRPGRKRKGQQKRKN
jgi:hypothetical protein